MLPLARIARACSHRAVLRHLPHGHAAFAGEVRHRGAAEFQGAAGIGAAIGAAMSPRVI